MKSEEHKMPLPEEVGGRDLQILSDNIPGGMFSCRFDERLTLLQMNKGFLSMLGYTRQEISDKFRNSFWEMIDYRDRLRTLEEVQRQICPWTGQGAGIPDDPGGRTYHMGSG